MEILSKQGGAELAGLGSARSWSVLAPRFLGAIALFTVGAVHLHEYNFLYSSIPTIGTLFMLTFISATLIGLGLLAPVERMLGRLGGAALALLAVAGAGQAALMTARASELVTVSLLGLFLVLRFAVRGPVARW